MFDKESERAAVAVDQAMALDAERAALGQKAALPIYNAHVRNPPTPPSRGAAAKP
jgi:hypothetical protein